MPDIVNLITTLGFLPVACIGLGWYVKHTTDQYREDVKELQKEHKEEIAKVTEALNNNTLALQRLCDKMDVERTSND